MKQIFAIFLIGVTIFSSCSKDSVNTRPSFTLKSFTPEVIPVSGNAEVKFSFGDKEADLDSIYIYKRRLNKQTTPTIRDSFKFAVPFFDKSTTGDISIFFTYQNHLISASNPPTSGTPPRRQPDTLIFKFVLKDKAKNNSDTIYSQPIVVLR